MAVMMCGLNLFSVVFSEEKANKLLLAQLLSPASLLEIIISKVILYTAVCSLQEVILLSLYRPWLLLTGGFWAIVFLGSLSYMSVASLIVMFSRKGSTANILTMGYVLLIGLVVLLSQDLPLFAQVKRLLPEMYIFSSMANLFDGRSIGGNIYSFAASASVLFGVSLICARFRGLKAA